MLQHHSFQQALWKLFSAPSLGTTLARADTIICRCENVTLQQVQLLIQNGITELGDLKRRSRLAMGRCQGRYCTRVLVQLLTQLDLIPKYQLYAAQIPSKPLSIVSFTREVPEWSGYKPMPVRLPVSDPINRQHFSTIDIDQTAKVLTDTPSPNLATIPSTIDTLIIGAGIVGSACAYYLSQNGVHSVLIDAGEVNGQASGANAGSLHLQSLSFDFQISQPGLDSLPLKTLVLQKHGIALWRELEHQLRADFQLVITGGMMVAESSEQMQFLERKTAAEKQLGIEVELCSGFDARQLEPKLSTAIVGASYCPGEGKIDPLRATPALVSAYVNAGGSLHSNTCVLAIERKNQRYTVTTTNGDIKCRRIVNAAGAWSSDIAALAGIELSVSCAPQQMIVTEPLQPLCSHLLAHAGRHLTMKQSANGNMIIGGGWFAGASQQSQRPRPLSHAIAGNLWVAQRVVPVISNCRVIRSWAAAGVMIDGAPILGETPGHKGFYHAVGANGYTLGVLMGKITSDLITRGRSDLDVRPFRPDRF